MTDIHLCITSGRGPVECQQAVVNVLNILVLEAEQQGLSVTSECVKDSAASVLLVVSGDGADMFAKQWKGTVLWSAKSRVREGHQRKNWYVAIRAIAPAPAAIDVVLSDLRFEAMRAGGPGGQHQNRTESAVRVTHVPTGIATLVRDERSQHRNKALGIKRIQSILNLRDNRTRNAKAFREWLDKTTVERGNPVRVLKTSPAKHL